MPGKSFQVILVKCSLAGGLILLLIWASYDSVQRMRIYLVNNDIEFKLQEAKTTKNKFAQYPVIARLLEKSFQISSSNPRTWLLAGNAELRRLANNTVNSSLEFQQVLSKAGAYYIEGLKLQPDNPFLWVNLAIVSQSQTEQKKRLQKSIAMAEKYGGSHPEVKQILALILAAEKQR